ncbi:MAG TPA: carboxypeptidase-like regulatory domain-containing protein [Terriglobia bacterium]|nr:carboxypeptidase-like regulatory domain-containing protein [Terriglobia bacterium]
MTVTDAADGSPIAGAMVQISGPQTQTATTGSDGTAPFPGIPAGGYGVTGAKTGYVAASASATVASAATNTASVQLKVVHAALVIREIAFSGNHVVEQDTLGDFSSPEWVEGRSQQSPVCYTRNTSVQLTAKFRVTTHPSGTEAVQVRGTATLGSATLQWTGSVSVDPGDNEVTTATLTSSAALPNQIDCFDPADINWEFNPAGSGWASAGNSGNVLYVTLDDPNGTPAYWTLLDISCRAASGDTAASAAVRHFFAPFGGRSLNRKRDGHALTYWNPNTTTCTNTALLLAAADGSGQCGSWAEFFVDMCKAHGITGADKVVIIRNQASMSTTGFLVKNWKFNHPPASSATAFTHDMYTECVKQPGIPGQNNPNPPPAFYNHFIVLFDGVFFDPSYGAGPFTTQVDWEAAAIDGLFFNPLSKAGFDKSLNSAVKLLEFWDLTTNSKI